MIDLEAELRRRVQALYRVALDLMSEEEARDLFCSITKRGRGKRGSGRNPGPPSKEAERKRRAREPKYEIVGELTEADLYLLDKYTQARLNGTDKK
jgi:hypothetical protein